MEKINAIFAKLPFKGFAEKFIPSGARTKLPLLDTFVIRFANQIAVALIVVLLVACIPGSGSGGGGGRPAPATDFSFQLNREGNGIIITGYNGSNRSVVIPSSIEGFPVVEIESAFSGNTTVTSIVIPNSVTVIGLHAFRNTSNLTSITIPNSVVAIGPGAFAESGLRSIVVPDSVVRIGQGAFENMPNLTRINIPAGIEEIRMLAFFGNGELTELIIPASLNSINFIGLQGHHSHFNFCSKLPIRTRQRLQELGYTGSF